jgi:hypothetical protein
LDRTLLLGAFITFKVGCRVFEFEARPFERVSTEALDLRFRCFPK